MMTGTGLSLPTAVLTLFSLVRHPQMNREQILTFQSQRLRRIVDHAYRNVPYYRRLFDRQGMTPQDIRTVADLTVLPFTTRNDLQEVPVSDLVAKGIDPSRLIAHTSSGSSGKPLCVRRSWLEERLHGAFRFRALRSLGLSARDVHCYVMGPRRPQPQDNQLIQRFLARLGVSRQMIVNGLQAPEEIVRTLHRHRPTIISGYPGVLARMAQTVNSQELRSLSPRFVTTSGEVLTPLMRQHIQDGFSAPVYDLYGSMEFNLLAWECRFTGEYHSCDDGLIMEIIRDDLPVGEGERGEVIGTDLHSFAMPLIRYRLGDVATKGRQSCNCGQPFSTIRSIQGRMIDYFVLPGDRLVHPYEFGIIKVPWIREFQVTQSSLNSIRMKVVPFHQPSAHEMEALVRPVGQLLGPDVQFQVDLVAEIPMEASGKFRVYRSHIRSEYDGCEWPPGTGNQAPGHQPKQAPSCENGVRPENTR